MPRLCVEQDLVQEPPLIGTLDALISCIQTSTDRSSFPEPSCLMKGGSW